MRWSFALFLTGTSALAQFGEPIFTRSAVPNPLGTVSLKMDFVNPVGATTGASSAALPESLLEIGLGRGLEAAMMEPLLRISEPNGRSVLAAGQFSIALRYLLAGSAGAKYAIAIAGRLEVPSGDSAIVGNETQLMPTVLAEWHATPRFWLRSNISWNTTVTGTSARFAYLAHSHAAVWRASRYFLPVFEMVSSADTIHGGAKLVLQPEVIVALNPHLEFKSGFSLGVVDTRRYTIRSQLAWFWGRRE